MVISPICSIACFIIAGEDELSLNKGKRELRANSNDDEPFCEAWNAAHAMSRGPSFLSVRTWSSHSFPLSTQIQILKLTFRKRCFGLLLAHVASLRAVLQA